MDESPEQPAASVKRIYALFFGSFALIPLSIAVGWFDTATVLIPRHERAEEACFAAAALGGLVCCAVCVYITRRLTIAQRIVLPLCLTAMSTISIFMLAYHAATILEGRLDFPAGKTRTRQVLFPIARAYRIHGKGRSQFIQTMPI